jgi:trans-aconitate 2-methyltransferase
MDAGCGTGRLTMLLAERLPNGFVVAVDRSDNMVRVAAETLAPVSARVAVVLADLSDLPFHQGFDVIFSTATFHWVLDHDRLFASLFDSMRPGGRLVAQCGGRGNLERIHRRAHTLMHSPELAPLFAEWREPRYYADPDSTHRRLRSVGFEDIETSIEPSPVTFPDGESFAAFVSAVMLRPMLAKITDERSRKSFVARITELAADDNPAYELDYWRLNLRARRP